MLSSSTVYAIRASIYIAAHKEDEYISISEIAKQLDISFHFLTKILQKLTQDKIMKSYRGPNGGVAFTKSLDKIYLSDIVKSIENNPIFDECILGISKCGVGKPCPLHEEWGAVRNRLKEKFENSSLADLAKGVKELSERLK
jgi:Rrf2 family transcriptional regulator, iron-sulfur cluster assembly transcription factor